MGLLFVAFVAFWLAILIPYPLFKRSPRGTRRLPGPRGIPLLGSVLDLPNTNLWMKFHEWGEKYGPIYQVNLAGHNHVWISLDHIAHDLLAKRSGIYSDRPFIPALQRDNRTSGQYLPLMSENALWKRQRRFAKHIMSSSEKASFHGYPELEAVRLLAELISSPSTYNVAMESFVSRTTCRLAWGTPTSSDELKQRARELLIGVSPNGSLLNALSFLTSLPERLVPAKAWESRRSRTEQKFFETMQEHVKSDSGANKSWMRMFLDQKSTWGFTNDTEGAFAVGMHGIAGALTIAAPMQSFCLAMCHYPQYQPILHEEIDRVLGDRMPELSDMPDMPVLRAFIRETLRWRPPVPTGIPHESTEDDVYEGYHIPAGSIIHALEWSIARDPAVYFQPNEWNPLRWLDPSYSTWQGPPSQYPTITGYSQFGYGKRLCQGMGIAEADLFVGLGSIAWLFSMHLNKPNEDTQNLPHPSKPETPLGIHKSDSAVSILSMSSPSQPQIATPPPNPKGQPDPTMNFSSLLIAKPLPFRFDLRIRNQARAEKVLSKFISLKMKGEFEDARIFWGDGKDTAGDAEFGWGKVFV